jgi:hypothetical protein
MKLAFLVVLALVCFVSRHFRCTMRLCLNDFNKTNPHLPAYLHFISQIVASAVARAPDFDKAEKLGALSMCASVGLSAPAGFSQEKCLVLSSLVLAAAQEEGNRTAKFALERMLGSNQAAVPAQRRTELQQSGNCAQDADACGCGSLLELECGVKLAACIPGCIASWGTLCVTCLVSIDTTCGPCVCYNVCQYVGSGVIASQLCPASNANCASTQ